ncbi:hypothetical protein EMIT0P218_130122 [Pseudomonas sp. IT-P218]
MKASGFFVASVKAKLPDRASSLASQLLQWFAVFTNSRHKPHLRNHLNINKSTVICDSYTAAEKILGCSSRHRQNVNVNTHEMKLKWITISNAC